MTTIKIQAEEELVTALNQIATRKLITMEALVKEVLLNYLQIQFSNSKSYSFIGIGHSSKGNISTQVETTLKKSANRCEGWSLS